MKVCIIGAGKRVHEMYIPVIHSLKNVSVSGIWYRTFEKAKNISEKEEIKNSLDIILKDFKKYGKDKPEEALKTLQSFCSDSNVIKSKDVFKLKQLFADGKYGIFLGKFDNFK